MTLFNTAELLFSIFIIFLSYRIINTTSVVESVLLLILLAINFSIFLFLYGIDFLAILYLAVYIGAVAVFFLFVVMMTDLDNTTLIENSSNFLLFNPKYKSVYFFLCSILGLIISNLIVLLISESDLFLKKSGLNFSFIDSFNLNIESIGFSMFNEHAGPFIIISLIILITLIGSIFITTVANDSLENLSVSNPPSLFSVKSVSDTNKRSQDMEVQLSRTFLNSINLSSNS